jgi:acyl-coenzyme A thioesterase PaaI-like protein
MKRELPNLFPDEECFVCGANNPVGLRLRFFLNEETKEVSTEYVGTRNYMGLGNVLHGGIQSSIIDEIMGWTTHSLTRQMGVAVNLNLNFIKPVYLGKRILAFCSISSIEDSKVQLEARLEYEDGDVCTTAAGIYYLLPDDKFEQLIYGKHG